ncbi:hypothetical protein EDB83DRAFT_1669174 [Lactarius deliciosus]|nr:hypothetical protein EDB83DRAFT_1669174 [Lactarius deliciosus]
MAPSLRSNTTPNGRSGIETTTTPTKSPRKVPHCTKCQRPRAGHPRQGCPYTNSPRHDAVRQDLSVSMDSLVISPRKTQLNARRRLPAHDITLASLSTESDNILNRLIQPEDTYEDFSLADGDVGTGPTPELPSASSRHPFQEGRIMPGTLITPAPSFLTETALLRETPQPSCHFDSKASIAMPPPKSTPPPLARSMSMEERTSLLGWTLRVVTGATCYGVLHSTCSSCSTWSNLQQNSDFTQALYSPRRVPGKKDC